MPLFECTVPTGFEFLAAKEIREKFDVEAKCVRGRVSFELAIACSKDLLTVLTLRSIESAFCVILSLDDVEFSKVPDEALSTLYKLVCKADWTTALEVWQIVFDQNWKGDIRKTVQYLNSDPPLRQLDDPASSAKVPTFRVTCYRSGSHSFESMPAAKEVGSEIYRRTKWIVKMKGYDMNVVVKVADAKVSYSISLTPDGSLHRRFVTHFGPTTLRPTICNGLLRLANLKPGEVVLDPLCGGGSIPLEACFAFPGCALIAGDNHPVAIEYLDKNIEAIVNDESYGIEERCAAASISMFQWDSTNLPLNANSIDVIVTDMPFGKRLGNKYDNRKLYPALLHEWARVVKPRGRAVLLTQDRKNMAIALQNLSKLWNKHQTPFVNVGGLEAHAYVISRRY